MEMNISPINPKYNHVSLNQRLGLLVGNKFRSDLTFLIEEDNCEIPAHKLIVGLASPVLDRIIYGNDTFPSADIVKVDGISKDSFLQILHYIYTDKIAINDYNVFEILTKSNYFGLPGIETECLNYLNRHLNISTVPWIYHQLFYSHSSSQLMDKCLQYIRIQPLQFFASEYFEKISIDELKSILRMEEINCSEFDLFKAMIKLSKALCIAAGVELTAANQRKVLDGAETLLRLSSLTDCEFNECLTVQEDFFTPTEVEGIRKRFRNSVSAEPKRKWYTYQGAVWIRINSLRDRPPSCFYSGHFIYRYSDADKILHVTDNTYKISNMPPVIDPSRTVEILCGSGYEWRKCVNGEILINSLSISENHSDPVFIGRRHLGYLLYSVGPAYLNGETDLGRSHDDVDVNDKTVNDDEYEILVASNVKNSNHEFRGVPPDAIFIGLSECNHDTFLGRAWYQGDLLPAKIVSTVGAFVSHGTEGPRVDHFDYVRMDAGTYDWVADENGNVPENAVIGGCTVTNENLYFGRVKHNGNNIPGKVHPSHRVLYVAYEGREINFSRYEVLVHV